MFQRMQQLRLKPWREFPLRSPFSALGPCAPAAAFDHEFDELGWLAGAFDA